jgi:hypothetical protein
MAEAGKPYTTIEGLTLEPAVERTVGRLAPLYAAFAAVTVYWDSAGFRFRKAQTNPDELPPDSEAAFFARRDFCRKWTATIVPFMRLLETGELVADVRSWEDLGAPLKRLRPDEASQLRIEVHHSANSLLLYGPGHERLYAVFSSRDVAPQPAPNAQVEVNKRPSIETPSEKTRKRTRKPHLKRSPSAVNHCTAYIVERLKKSPKRPTTTLAKLRLKCRKEFKVTWRDFRQAWNNALAQVPEAKAAWTAPGRR